MRGTVTAVRLLAALAVPVALGSGGARAAENGASAHCFAGKARSALVACKAAVKADPGSERLHRRLAHVYIEIDQYEDAIVLLTKMAAKWPRSWRPHYDIASIYAALQNYKGGIKPIEASLRIKSDNATALMLAALIYNKVRRRGDAFQAFRKAAVLGERVAMFQTSFYYENGLGTRKDPIKAGLWLKRAAEAGHIGAMDRMTRLYLEGGLGFQPNDKLAEQWATRARRARYGK